MPNPVVTDRKISKEIIFIKKDRNGETKWFDEH